MEDNRWNFEGEITKVLELSLEQSFPELEHELNWVQNEEADHGDYTCLNVFNIWPKLRGDPKLRQKYPDIEVPKHIGDVISNNLMKFAGEMIQESSVRDVGVVVFSLSRKWLAESIHKMLKDGIDTWAPKLPVETVIVDFPALEEKKDLGWFRQQAIGHTLVRMLEYSKVHAVIYPYSYFPELESSSIPPLRREWGKSILTNPRDRDALIYVENKPPFILEYIDLHKSDIDMKKLWWGSNKSLADWIIYVTPAHQQEYIEMCFTAAKLEGWIRTDDIKGKWNPSHENQCPLLTYAGYRAYSSTKEFIDLYDRIIGSCVKVARGEAAQLLEYTADAVLKCVLVYTCLKNHRLADCTFNSDEMLNKEGNTFVYLLHRLAEVHEGIDELKKASDLILEEYEGCGEGEERMLEFHLLQFTEFLEVSCLYVSPHVMCEYLYDLSKKFKSYNDFVRRTGRVAKTNKLLLCEATAVVMEKCFNLLGINNNKNNSNKPTQSQSTPEVIFTKSPLDALLLRLRLRSVQTLPMDKEKLTRRELESVDRFITPCFVSDARDPTRKSRFEVFSICPWMAEGSMFKKGHLFGRILISDKYGLRSDRGVPAYEPGVSYVPLFEHKWYDPVNMPYSRLVYIDHPSYNSVPFSSSIGVRMELNACSEEKDYCFQLCNTNIELDLEDFWAREEINSELRCVSVKGEVGKILMYYIPIKNAVDAFLELSFKAETDAEVEGRIFAYYGDKFPLEVNFCYEALLFRSGLISRNKETYEIIPLKRCTLAVPKYARLIIDASFVDVKTQEVILFDSYDFFPPTEECSSEGCLFGKDFSLKMRVVWKY